MRHGLPGKIRVAFIAQVVIASLAIVVGSFLLSAVVKHSLVKTALNEEAAHFWQLYREAGTQPPPNTFNLRGYLVPTGESTQALPENLRALGPGFHDVERAQSFVLVDEQPAGRLYLVFLNSQAERLAFWFGTLPILLTLVALYVVSWLTWRASTRLVSPVSWLADQVARWDPRAPDASSLAPERLPPDVQGEARQLAAALYQLSQRVATQVARERSFTRDASHELRTPLTVIRMATDMAMAEEASPRLSRALQRIQRAGRDMEALIEAFLILAREIDIEPQSEEFEVAEVLLDEAEDARALLLGKQVDLQVTCNASPRLFAPRRVLHVVVGNLLRNACSYTDHGHIEVVLEQDRVMVRDTGIGMGPEAIAQAFEPFYRPDQGRPQGIGLGLSIVRRLCDRMGWEVELESEQGKGTVATVRFAS